jgi:anti-sigma factor RsiW
MDKLTKPPCEEWAPKLAALHAGDLSPAERAALEAHLAACPTCAAALADYQMLAEQVRHLPERASQQDIPPKVRELWNKRNNDEDQG